MFETLRLVRAPVVMTGETKDTVLIDGALLQTGYYKRTFSVFSIRCLAKGVSARIEVGRIA